MRHEKKVLPNYFQEILDGKKTYELRLASWECQEGDTLILHEWPEGAEEGTGRTLKKRITGILKTRDIAFWSKEDIEKYGFQIISFE